MSSPAELLPVDGPVERTDTAPNAPIGWATSVDRWHVRTPMAWRIADAMLALAVLTAVMLGGNLNHMPHGWASFLTIRVSVKNVLLLAAFGAIWPAILSMCGLYSAARLRSGTGEWSRLVLAATLGCVCAMVFPLTSRSGLITPVHIVVFGVLIVLASRLLRMIVRITHGTRYRMSPRQIVLIGSGPLASRMYRQLLSDPGEPVAVVGFVDSDPHPEMVETAARHLGVIDELEYILMRRVVDDVLIGLPVKSCYDDIRESLRVCARVGVRASYSGDLFGAQPAALGAQGGVAAMWSVSHTPPTEMLAIKRLIDIAGAALLLILFAPLMAIIAVLIKATSPGPVLFAQDRFGYLKRVFRMYKFRTMVADAETLHEQLEDRNEATGPVFKIRDDPRVTSLGRFLRRSSLDELPQLWNVLRGDMSLVGPRPMATRDVGRFAEPWLMRRFSMRPGLTCLWQISGRSDLTFDRWIALDLEYIDRWSPLLDLQILLLTLPAVVRGAGAM